MKLFLYLLTCLSACGQLVNGTLVNGTLGGAAASGVNNLSLSNYWKLADVDATRGHELSDSVGICPLIAQSDNAAHPYRTNGVQGYAVHFDWNQTAYGFTNTLHTIGNEDFSFTCWFKPGTTNTYQAIAYKGSSANRQFMLAIGDSGLLYAALSSDGETWDKLHTNTANLTIGGWHFAALTHNAATDTLTLYLYSTSAELAITSMGSVGSLYAADSGLFNLAKDLGTSVFNGSLDEVGLWFKCMSAAEVLSEWNAGAGVTHP